MYAKPIGRNYRTIPRGTANFRQKLIVKIDLSKIKLKNRPKNNDGEEDDDFVDDYAKRLAHVQSCRVKTIQLAKYREFDRNIFPVTE